MRPQTKSQKIKDLYKAHFGKKAYLWICTGHHKYRIQCLEGTQPFNCPMGHPFTRRNEILMSTFLKDTINRIRESS